MILILVRKILRDIRVPLLVFCLLLAGFEGLWVKVTERVTGQLVPLLRTLAVAQKMSLLDVEKVIFQGPGRVARSLMGGEQVTLARAMDVLSIGYVHPLVQTLLCIWAVGRAAGAIAGEIDRGTMELLLAQPIPRESLIFAHLIVDLVTIPLLCLSLWAGSWIGTIAVGPIRPPDPAESKLPMFQGEVDPALLEIRPAQIGPALWNVAALVFGVSGMTMWLSARGRFRWRVLALAVFVVLIQFLINLLGMLWDAAGPLRPLSVFYYYQPQQVILRNHWTVDFSDWNGGLPLVQIPAILPLLFLGVLGYTLAVWTFRRRDLPAPL